MGAAVWHVIDNAGSQLGPMDAEAVRAALDAGSLSPASLAWREGMSNWRPVRELAAELGLPPPAPATPPPPPAHPEAASPYEPMPHAGLVVRERATDIVYAGFVRRWAALMLDQLLLAVPMVVVVLGLGIAGNAGSGAPPSDAALASMLVVYGLWFVGSPLYYALMESSRWQATLGKRALGIKVVDAGGHRIGFGQALGRWFAAALSYLTFYIGFLMAAFTERKQALHDLVAGTLVVDRWAYTEHPERQKRGLSGCLVVFLIVMALVPILAILAAISISQYQDYVIRSQVSEGASLADGVKTAVGEYYQQHQEFPANNAAAGLAAPSSIAGAYVTSVDIGQQPGRIDVTYSAHGSQRANAALDGRHLVFIGEAASGSLRWTCASDDLPQKWCPSSCDCRGTSGVAR